MLDYIEYLKIAAEVQFEKMTEGLPSGKFRCSCGEIEDISNGNTATANPYSEIICGSCQERLWPEIKYQK